MTERHLLAASVLANLSGGISASLSTMMPTFALKWDEGRNKASGTCSPIVVVVDVDVGTVETMTLGGGPCKEITSSVWSSSTLPSGSLRRVQLSK